MAFITGANLGSEWLADGLRISGGTIRRAFEFTGGDIDLVAQQNTVVNLPNLATVSLIAAEVLTAKGSMFAASAAGVVEELLVGNDGEVMVADSTAPLGVAWKPVQVITHEVVNASKTAAVNTCYTIDAASAALVALALPAVSAVGDIIRVRGMSPNLWEIAQAAGQQIFFLGVPSTVGASGKLSSTQQYDAIEIECVTANTEWIVTAPCGNFDVV